MLDRIAIWTEAANSDTVYYRKHYPNVRSDRSNLLKIKKHINEVRIAELELMLLKLKNGESFKRLN